MKACSHSVTAGLGIQLGKPHLTDTPCKCDKQITTIVSKLGVGRQGPNYLTGGHLDGGKVVIAVGDGVRDVIKEGNIEMTIVCISLDNLEELICFKLCEVITDVSGHCLEQILVIEVHTVQSRDQVRDLICIERSNLGLCSLSQLLESSLIAVAGC